MPLGLGASKGKYFLPGMSVKVAQRAFVPVSVASVFTPMAEVAGG